MEVKQQDKVRKSFQPIQTVTVLVVQLNGADHIAPVVGLGWDRCSIPERCMDNSYRPELDYVTMSAVVGHGRP